MQSARRAPALSSPPLALIVVTSLPRPRRIEIRQALLAVRDDERRLRLLGYRFWNYKLVVLVGAALVAAIAGALYVPQVGIINPGDWRPDLSLEIAVWVASAAAAISSAR